MQFSSKFTLFGDVEALGKLDGISKIQNVKNKKIKAITNDISRTNKNPQNVDN